MNRSSSVFSGFSPGRVVGVPNRTSAVLCSIVTVAAGSLVSPELAASSFTAVSEGVFGSTGVPPADVSVWIDHASVGAIWGGSPLSFVSLKATETVQFPYSAPPEIVDGKFMFNGPAGDALWGTFTAQMLPAASPGAYSALGPLLFTGGTGMFTGARGSGELIAAIQFTDAASGFSTITWTGDLTVPDAGASLGLLGLSGLALLALRRGRPE